MTQFALFAAALIFLVATAFLSAITAAFRRIHMEDPNKALDAKGFFYRPWHLTFFPKSEYAGLLCAAISAQNITRFFYTFFALSFLLTATPQTEPGATAILALDNLWNALIILGFVVAAFLFGEYIPRIIGAQYSKAALKYCTPLASFFMLIAFPITYLSIRLSGSKYEAISFEEPLTQTKREIIEIIQKTKLRPELNLHEKKLIESVLRFKDRIAREVMVPRVDVFSLSAETPIYEAVKLVSEEGYSRIPIYRNTVDNIVGVLMYKDLLNTFMEYRDKGNAVAILEAPIESIRKGVLYTPETKKISNLLLEFKKKQVHLAIVVDEYGGTEGIVTIEDILEEIVGEIEDEYDEEEELFFTRHQDSWIVDARMSILDAEEQLSVVIPQEGDYDTIGGYIFHEAGSIPTKGFVIHHEKFEMEVLRSDERRVRRVRIKPIPRPTSATPRDNSPKNKEPPHE